MRRALTAIAFAAPLFAGGAARADEARCGSQRAWVELSSALPRELVHKIESDLGAELAANQIDVCERDATARDRPIATVVLAPSATDPDVFSIDVTDSVTYKRIGRDVDVGRVPSDGRSLALAVAADELLRASWAELTIDRQQRAAAPPAETKASEEPFRDAGPSAPPGPTSGEIGARFAFEHYASDETAFGVDAFFARAIGAHFRWSVALGFRAMVPIESQEGKIMGSAVRAQIGGGPVLARTASLELALLVALAGSRVTYSARPGENATGNDATGYALYARGGLELSLGSAGFPLRSRTSAGAGAPLRSFAAADGNGIVAGVKGLEIFAATGAALEF